MPPYLEGHVQNIHSLWDSKVCQEKLTLFLNSIHLYLFEVHNDKLLTLPVSNYSAPLHSDVAIQ